MRWARVLRRCIGHRKRVSDHRLEKGVLAPPLTPLAPTDRRPQPTPRRNSGVSPVEIRRGRRGGRCGKRPRGRPCAPRLADPFRSLLPHGDPFGELGQVGAAAMQKGGLERLAWPPAVPLLAVTGSLAQRQVAGSATAGVLAGSCIALLRLPSHLLGGHSREIRPDCVALRLALFLSAFQHTQKRMAA